MRSALVRVALGVVLGSGLSASWTFAEEGAKALPTLLIKGEVVSLDMADPSTPLLKVKDRYGFETPIFVTQETMVTQDGANQQLSSLAAGAQVEVEYNFDVNTAKRHAVSVKVAGAADAAPAVAPEPAAFTAELAAPPAEVSAPAEPTPPAASTEAAPQPEAVPAQ